MERTGQREQVRVLERAQSVTSSSLLAGGGMVAFLVALALLFVVSGPA
jgi:hypothetical protein